METRAVCKGTSIHPLYPLRQRRQKKTAKDRTQWSKMNLWYDLITKRLSKSKQPMKTIQI